MRVSEFEYHTMSLLITMADRELAHKVELDIFRYGPSPDNSRLQLYVAALKASETELEAVELFRAILDKSGMEFVEDSKFGWCTPNSRMGIKVNDAEYFARLVEGENLECR